MKKLRIGVDVDGVLANFNRGFAQKLAAVTGRALADPETINPETWDWPAACGWTLDEVAETWRLVESDLMFWRTLSYLQDAHTFLWALARSAHDVYFITARPGFSAKTQTECWLERYYPLPTVLISELKGYAAVALSLDVYIDDRRENCGAVVQMSQATRVYMPFRPYNTCVDGVWGIQSILEILEREAIPYDGKAR